MKFEKYTQYLKEGESVLHDGSIDVNLIGTIKSPIFESDFGIKIYQHPKFATNGILYIGGDVKFWNVPTVKGKAKFSDLEGKAELSKDDVSELSNTLPKLKNDFKKISEEFLEKVSKLFEDAGFRFGSEAELKAAIKKTEEPEETDDEKSAKKNGIDLADLEDF